MLLAAMNMENAAATLLKKTRVEKRGVLNFEAI